MSVWNDPSVMEAEELSAPTPLRVPTSGNADIEMAEMTDGSVFSDPSVTAAVADLAAAETFFASSAPMLHADPYRDELLGRTTKSLASSFSGGALPAGVASVPAVAFLGGTLHEPVLETVLRDVRQMMRKLGVVIRPFQSQATALEHLRDWDLWGPLLITIVLASTLAAAAPDDQQSVIFSLVFVIIWLGAAVVTLNAALLGGRISFLQSVCVLGYSVFPVCVTRILIVILEVWVPKLLLVRLLLVVPALVWSTKASVLFIGEVITPKRRFLAIYPVIGFYTWLSWLVVVV